MSRSRGGGGSAASGTIAQLVDQIKAGQRGDPAWKDRWCAYCDEYGNGSYDPARYDAGFLRRALRALPAGGGNVAELASEVRRAQREGGDAVAQKWREHCDKWGHSVYDPLRHDAQFIADGLRRMGWSARGASSPARWSARGAGSPAHGRHDQLCAEVKALQRESQAHVDAWRAYCEQHGDGSYDPARYDEGWLARALRTVKGGGGGGGVGGGSGGGPLTDRCKELQRLSRAARLQWERHCDENGDGSYDPTRYSAAFVSEGLSKMERSHAMAGGGGGSGGGGGGGGLSRGGGTVGNIVEQIKALQRDVQAARAIWVDICERHGDGTLDPTRYDPGFLKRALQQMHAVAGGGGGGGGGRRGAPASSGGGRHEEINLLCLARRKAQMAREFERADQYRDMLTEMGVTLNDRAKTWRAATGEAGSFA
eukprot:TRINITY_DN16947_c1_g1_i2.p2 TRINITY_DN16947_c1_g1~~TRINITY_DN16947_c1_g1_i2.p2  ORF type:complete len:455 (+),score=144.10 TRINITY_DN16947_c1_g1_i2:91-1365(+)